MVLFTVKHGEPIFVAASAIGMGERSPIDNRAAMIVFMSWFPILGSE
jgi:hypothetical protein